MGFGLAALNCERGETVKCHKNEELQTNPNLVHVSECTRIAAPMSISPEKERAACLGESGWSAPVRSPERMAQQRGQVVRAPPSLHQPWWINRPNRAGVKSQASEARAFEFFMPCHAQGKSLDWSCHLCQINPRRGFAPADHFAGIRSQSTNRLNTSSFWSCLLHRMHRRPENQWKRNGRSGHASRI